MVQSGGTLGRPKCLLRPQQTWLHSAQVEAKAFGFGGQERFAVFGSKHHSLWSYVHFRARLVGAPCLGLTMQEIPAYASALRSKWDALAPTVVYAVPELMATFARLFLRQSVASHSVRALLLGGGPVLPSFPKELVQSVFPNASLWSFYGTTEASFVGYRRFDGPRGHFSPAEIANCAQPIRDARLVRGKPAEERLATYELFSTVEIDIRSEGDLAGVGEVWVRSPMTLTPKVWVSTGDLGGWAAGGRLQLLGRSARRLVIKGEKYLVEPVEESLVRHFGFARLALIADPRGQVACFMARSAEIENAIGKPFDEGLVVGSTRPGSLISPTLVEINSVIRSYAPKFPRVRRLFELESEIWPLTSVGKTDFLALKRRLEGVLE